MVAVLLLGINLLSSAQQPVVLSDPSKIYQLDEHARVFIDSLGVIDFNQVMYSSFQYHFKPSGTGSLAFGYLNKPIWIKLKLSNQAIGTQWYLEIPAPYLEFVHFYQQQSGKWVKNSSGYYLPHSEKEISHTAFSYLLDFDGGAQSEVFICVTGISSKNIPLFVLEKEKFLEKSRLEDVGYGIFFGVLLVMILFNLVIFLTLKDINYLIYVCIICCTFSIFSAASGYGGKFLWPNYPDINFYAGRLSLGIMVILISIFSRRFLETQRYSKTMDFVLLLLIPLAIIATVLVATEVMSSAGNNLMSVATPIFLISGIVCWVKGNKNAQFFVAAWAVYLIGGLSITLRNSGVLPYNFWTTHLAEVGAACETFLIALALSSRYTRLKKENEEAQLSLIDQLQKNQKLQQQATADLETKVNERTQEILQQNEKLSKLNLLKDKLFTIISHDLKSPLSQLSGALYLVERDMITKEEIKDLMPKIRRNLANNENFLSELLAWTRSQLEGEKISLTYFNLKNATDEIVRLILLQAEAKKIEVISQLKDNTIVYADVEMIKTVIRNLMVNAIKFTDTNGSIEIFVKVTNDTTTYYVKDTGKGIEDSLKGNLFTMHVQSMRGTANEKGTGLGLLICKDFVESNGGTIWVEGKPNEGSIFAFTIPNHPTDNHRP
ncbi:MAG: 7TM diverse intracellular signaling domain-containing protein [Flammeovirgaceae bacterium]